MRLALDLWHFSHESVVGSLMFFAEDAKLWHERHVSALAAVSGL
jgi:hypothetical protein